MFRLGTILLSAFHFITVLLLGVIYIQKQIAWRSRDSLYKEEIQTDGRGYLLNRMERGKGDWYEGLHGGDKFQKLILKWQLYLFDSALICMNCFCSIIVTLNIIVHKFVYGYTLVEIVIYMGKQFSHFWDRAVPVFSGVRFPCLVPQAHTRLFPVKSLLCFSNFNQDLNYFHLSTILLHKYF